MATVESDWEIEPDADDELADQALSNDRLWNGYSIADLDPPYRAYTQLAVARHAQHEPAVCLILRHPAFVSTITSGHPAGLAAILRAIELPPSSSYLTRSEHLPALAEHYRFVDEQMQMIRMWVDAAHFQSPPPGPPVEQLGMDDLDALRQLYTSYAASSFNVDQLATGPFFGVREHGRLVAAGGVHVVAPHYAIGAVGNIFTLPEARGRGYGLQVTAAVVARLLNDVCREVILNVAADNPFARRVYTRLGFQEHCRFVEGHIQRLLS